MRVYPVLLFRYKFEVMDMGDEKVAVCVGDDADKYHGMIKLSNKPASFMFEKLQQGITLPELILLCMREFEQSDINEVGHNVIAFLDELRDQGVLAADTTRGIKDDRDEVQ